MAIKNTNSFFYWGLIFIFFFISCNRGKSPQKVFNEKTPGRKVMETYENNSPKAVAFFEEGTSQEDIEKRVGEMYYYENNQVYMVGGIKNNKRDGVWEAFFEDGTLQSKAFYIDGKEDGDYKVYHPNGKLLMHGHYDNGICDGVWKFYDQKGKLQKEIHTKKGEIACGTCERCQKISQSKNINN